MSENEVMDQQSKSNFNSPSGPDCLATKQFIIKKFLSLIINLDLKEMLKSLGQILLLLWCKPKAIYWSQWSCCKLKEKKNNYLHILWKILFYALSLGSTYYCFKYLLLYKYGYFLQQIIDFDFFFIYTSCATVISNICKGKGLDLKWSEWLYQKPKTKPTKSWCFN